MVQWLKLHAFTARGLGAPPDQERSYMSCGKIKRTKTNLKNIGLAKSLFGFFCYLNDFFFLPIKYYEINLNVQCDGQEKKKTLIGKNF